MSFPYTHRIISTNEGAALSMATMNKTPTDLAALKGEALATAYAAAHPLTQENPGKVWAHYEGGGWIVLRGEGLKPSPKMAARYPGGWSLLARVRSGAARAAMASGFAALRSSYANA